MKPRQDIDTTRLTEAVNALQDALGQVGTDASALDRIGAQDFLEVMRLNGRQTTRPEVVAILDSPSGYTQRRRIVLIGTRISPKRFEPPTRAALGRHINTVLDYELPVVLHRWAFDQVMDAWLGEMQLSASAVISVQRSLLLVKGDLMVRVGKVVSDPRAQMVSLREQTVLNPEQDDARFVLPRHSSHHLAG
jgi:hypothetical protein